MEHSSHVLGDRGSGLHRFESWSSQTNDLKIDTCRFQARCSGLLGSSEDSLAQCQDNLGYQVMVLVPKSLSGAEL